MRKKNQREEKELIHHAKIDERSVLLALISRVSRNVCRNSYEDETVSYEDEKENM